MHSQRLHVLSALAATFMIALALPVSAERPNIVYILATISAMATSAVSIRSQRSRRMGRLAAESIAFTDAHSGSAVCTPPATACSRAATRGGRA